MTDHPSELWKRLGELLVRRRVELDPRYRNRRTFTGERAPKLYRIINDLELGRRDSYEASTFAAVEQAYDLAPGAIARFLAGGDLIQPEPALPEALDFARSYGINPDDADDPFLSAVRAEIKAGENRFGLDATGAQIFGTDPDGQVESVVWDAPDVGRETKAVAIAGLRADRARRRAARERLSRNSGTAGLVLVGAGVT